MDERLFYSRLLWGWAALAAGAFIALLIKTAPYGRFARKGWGPSIPGRLSWAVMEGPALVVFTLLFIAGNDKSPTAWVFLALWDIHYIYRSVIYATRLRTTRQVPLFVTSSGFVFSVINGYLQARYLFTLAEQTPMSWLAGWTFWVGLFLFLVGLAVNTHSDAVLRSLRRPGEGCYVIPRGGLFEYVSCPNYFGEIIEWTGWAVLTWSPPGLVFAVWTAANLVPRALACHRWYRLTFPDYPPKRKAILPKVF